MVSKCNFATYIFVIVLIKKCVCDDTVQINFNQGILEGKVLKTFFKEQSYYSFKGIPYAEPPIGKLRFKPPVTHKGWKDKYEAFDQKPACIQLNSRMRNGETFGVSGLEDCLYLNVFTPSTKKSAPVVVFDYNDGFRSGFNGTDTYSPDFFLEENIVVVTIHHRLGPFGYLTTEDEVIPANAGLKDFILGLIWIRDNIKHFGGNSGCVTLMGSRGGAAIADILLYSHLADGLFNRVILQSGTSLEPIYFYDSPSKKAFEFGETFNITTNDSQLLLEELQKLDAKEILNMVPEIIDTEGTENKQRSVFPFSPAIEHKSTDAVLSTLPENALPVRDVPVIIGFNSREGLDLISYIIFEPKILAELTDNFAIHLPMREHFRFNPKSSVYKQALEEVMDYYLNDRHLSVEYLLEYAVYIGDALQNYAQDFAAKKLAAALNSPVYYYMFDFRGTLNENSEYMTRNARSTMKNWGATIGDELCYLHVCSRIKRNYKTLKDLISEQPEIKVLKKMVRLWTNFVKTGNPTPSKQDDDVLKDFTWEPINVNEDHTNYLHITKTLRMKTDPLGARAKFWDEFLNKYSKMAVDGVVQDDIERDEL